VCPSPAAFAIGLGPTNPSLTIIERETLVFRRRGFSPLLWLLVPTFLLRNAPPWVTPLASLRLRILSYRSRKAQETFDLWPLTFDLAEFRFAKFCGQLSNVNCQLFLVLRTSPQFRYIAWAPIIFGAESLDEWAVTLSLNDGCF